MVVLFGFTLPGRHQNPECCTPRLRVAFDDSTVIANDLRHQCKSKARSVWLGGYERIEEMRQDILWHAVTAILDAELQGQGHTIANSRHG